MELLTEKWIVPTWAMVLVVAVLTVSLFIGVPLARAAGRRRGYRLAHQEEFHTSRERAKDTALFLAALVPSLLVWLAVMGVSFIGLTGFAADVMQWDHWTNILVPLSLDGISVSFGAWAFVAVKRGRHPGRAYKIVLAAATMSAALNFVHGRDKWSIWAGLYLAFLSMAGMAMFHELLDQFMAGYDDEVALKTRYPRFGQRWLYAPVSTFAARRAWIVHPPEEGIRPSIRNALDHLEGVREAKRQRRLAGAYRTREEQQAKLVEVHARAEVRRAKQATRRPDPVVRSPLHGTTTHGTASHGTASHGPASHGTASHGPVVHGPAAYGSSLDGPPLHGAPAQRYAPPAHSPVSPGPSVNGAPVPQLEPAAAPEEYQPESEQARAPERLRAPRPLEPVLDPVLKAELEQVLPIPPQSLGRNPLADQFADETQQMIADALSLGEQVTVGQIRDYVLTQHGHRVSVAWAQAQLKAARTRDTFGVDADLL